MRSSHDPRVSRVIVAQGRAPRTAAMQSFPEQVSRLLWVSLALYLVLCAYLTSIVARGDASRVYDLGAAVILSAALVWEMILRLQGGRVRLVNGELLFRRHFFARSVPLEPLMTTLTEEEDGFALDSPEMFATITPFDRDRFRAVFAWWKAGALGRCRVL